MSVIIGLVKHKYGLVLSDGRLTSGAKYENSELTEKANIISNEFDKTFSLSNGNIIGAVAGIMKFQDKYVSEHLEEIFSIDCNKLNSIEEKFARLTDVFQNRIENIPDSEILFCFRKIDLILIASTTADLKNLKIYNYSFNPDPTNNSITIHRDQLSPQFKWQVRHQTYGATAQNVVDDFLKKEINKNPNISNKALLNISKNAIRVGIKNSNKNQHGNDLCCGGKTYFKSIK